MARLHLIIPATLLLLTSLSTHAGDAPTSKLEAGSPAPTLEVSSWLQGEEVKNFEKGTVYVVECWASWCGPCKMMIPHISELNTHYTQAKKKIVFIGVDVWERDAKAGPVTFESMKSQMNYRVAVDGGQVAKNWLQAAGMNGIPTAFVVDGQGKIAWIGHPMELEDLLDDVIAGTFDHAAHTKIQNEIDAANKEAFKLLGDGKDAAKAGEALKVLDAAITAHPKAQKSLRFTRHACMIATGDIATLKTEVEAGLKAGIYADLMTGGRMADHMLKNMPGDNRQLDLIDKILEQANTKDQGHSVLLLMTTATLRVAQGRKEDARKLYQSTIEKADHPRVKQMAEDALKKLDA